MSFLIRALATNANLLNYVVIGGAALIPVLYYAQQHSPSSEALKEVLVENRGDELRDANRNSSNVVTFWTGRRTSAEMDDVYAKLLRAGSSGAARHYELTGPLADVERRQREESLRQEELRRRDASK